VTSFDPILPKLRYESKNIIIQAVSKLNLILQLWQNFLL